tara:strand:+ start:505 stop:714 length:210 start_codon:yes stop_codon:yes gene_type:complete
MFKRLPEIEPLMKLIPTIKLMGKLTVSLIIKLTFLLLELFCIPIIRIKNKVRLNVNVNNALLRRNIILI